MIPYFQWIYKEKEGRGEGEGCRGEGEKKEEENEKGKNGYLFNTTVTIDDLYNALSTGAFLENNITLPKIHTLCTS